MTINSRDLQKRVVDIFDFAYTNSSIRVPAKTCREVGKIFHVGMYIEEITNKIPAFTFTEKQKLELDGNDNSASGDIAAHIRKTYKKMNSEWAVYEDKDILFDDKCIGYIVKKLDGIYISDPKRDVFGDALEIFRSKWAKQEGGQFFTDQRVTTLAIEMLEFNPYKGDDLVDICAGTGGFLLAGFNKIKELVDKKKKTEKEVLELAAKSLKGQEIDKDVSDLGNSTLTARMGRYVEKVIQQGNSLDENAYNDGLIKPNTHLCLATNPPFGAKITIKDTNILKQYELAKLTNANVVQNNYSGSNLYRRAPDILFVERNIKLLKPGKGRLAIVIPYQIISGPQALFVRDWILRNAKIISVIDLPSETFQPHTGTKTALVIVERRKEPLLNVSMADEDSIFMAVPRWIGHDRRGNPVYKKNQDGSESSEILSDFEDIKVAYAAYKKGDDPKDVYNRSFVVKVKDIIGDELLRLNAQYHFNGSDNEAERVDFDESKWEIRKISDVVERIFYPGRFKRDYVERYDGAIPFLGGANITQLVISTDKWLRHDDPKLDQLSIKEGWLLVTRSGTTGIVSSVPAIWNNFAMSEHVIRIVPDERKLSSAYILAFLKTDYCQNQIAKNVFGSVIDEITPEAIGEIEIPIPKDKAFYKAICEKIKKAEKSKQIALESLYEGVDDLSAVLSDK